MKNNMLQEPITLSQARSLIKAMGHKESILLLSAPGVGKTDSVYQIAEEMNYMCNSLLGTQLAPEDVVGIPKIEGQRSVFYPPRVILPEKLPEDKDGFMLFLDEFPAAHPDIQKAFYSILLERRIGEYPLPDGAIVVAAGNRPQDNAFVRALSSALINRVFILHVRVDLKEWVDWAEKEKIRSEIIAFIRLFPKSLMREVPSEPIPFSTPRAWASLSKALDLAEKSNLINNKNDKAIRRALAFGRLSADDAQIFTCMEKELKDLLHPNVYIKDPGRFPKNPTAQWFIISQIRGLVETDMLIDVTTDELGIFFSTIPNEFKMALVQGLTEKWGELGADDILYEKVLKEIVKGL